MRLYDILAEHYDGLMSHFDYTAWVELFEQLTHERDIKSVVDLACGTGNLTAMLSKRGYDVIGVDSSAAMLSCAAERMPDVLWLMQPIEELDLYGTVDACVCCLDGFNHLPDMHAVEQALSRVKLFLNPHGILMFDMLTPQHFDDIDGQTFVSENGDFRVEWKCHLEPPQHCRYDFTVGRHNITHRQLIIQPDEVDEVLRRLGFAVSWHDFHGTGPERRVCWGNKK